MPKMVHEMSFADWPASANPVSRVVEASGLVFVSGQAGIRPGDSAPIPGGIGAETRQALENIGRLLRAVGLDYNDVVKTTVYLKNFSDFEGMNIAYREFFTSAYPVRFTTGVTDLLNGARIEIEALAAR